MREGQDYRDLRATVSIAILNTVLFPNVADFHLDFQLRSSAHPQLIFSPHQAIHVLELPKFSKTVDQPKAPLDVWCYFLTHAAQLDTDLLPEAFQTPPLKRAMEVLTMLSKNDVERERYRSRLK